jgi:hypothetical protein
MIKVTVLTILSVTLLFGCSGKAKTSNVATIASSPTETKTETVAAITTPDKPSCHREFVSVKRDTFDECILIGMSYRQVIEVFGYRGKLVSQADRVEIWEFNGGSGKEAMLTFTDGKLSIKSQSGLAN